MGGGRGGGDRQTELLLEKLSESSYNSSEQRLVRRTGTVWTAMAHIITAVIGSGVLSLAWSVAQLGWVGGPAAILFFAGVTVVQSSLIADCYISRDPDERGAVVRNKSYVQAVKLYLGENSRLFCGFFLSVSLFGSSVVYTITSATSMRAIQKANCYHSEGHGAAACSAAGGGSDVYYMVLFGLAQVVLSQIPDFHDMAWLSVFAAVMSFSYSFIGFGLGAAKVIGRKRSDQGGNRGHCPGIPDAEGLARRAGPRGHRLRLPLLLGAAGDRGHTEVAAGGERDDEDGLEGQHRGHHLLLPRLRVLRLCGVRRRHPGEPPHRLRILRALLAHRLRQRLRRPPPPRRLPGVQPAGVRAHGAAVRRRRLLYRRGGAAARPEARERVQAVLPHGVRGGGDGGGRVVPLLQPGSRADRRLRFLAAGHPLPCRDVHRAGQGGSLDGAVARRPGLQRRLPARLRLRLPRLRRGGVRLQGKLDDFSNKKSMWLHGIFVRCKLELPQHDSFHSLGMC